MLGKVPAYLCIIICFILGRYQLHSSKCLLFNIYRDFTELGKTAYSYYAPCAWNNLQKDLDTFGDFKGIIKRVEMEACFFFFEREDIMFKYSSNLYLLYFKMLSYLMAVTLARSLL